jgi:hypothetical protein
MAAAQAQLTLNFTAWYQTTLTIQQGEPLVLDVSLLDYGAQSRATENQARALELEQLQALRDSGTITSQVYEDRAKTLQPLPLGSTTVGTTGKPWYEEVTFEMETGGGWVAVPWAMQLLNIPKAEPQVTIDDVKVAIAAFGIDPSVSGGISEGTHRLRAKYAPGTGIESQVIEIRFVQAKANSEWTPAQKLRLGRYWWMRGDHEKSLAVADELLAENPLNIDALAIKGNALAGLNREAEAVGVFQTAIDQYYVQFPDAYEPPDYLIDRWIELNEAIERK